MQDAGEIRDKTNEASLRRLVEANADGIVIVDRLGVIRFANPAAERLFIQSKERLIGAAFGFPIVSDETTEIEIVGKRDEATIAEMRVVTIEWQGQPAYLASLRDITKRKTRERFLGFLNDITHTALEVEDFSLMLQLLADRLGVLFHADECYITLWDEAQQVALPGAAYGSLQDQYPNLYLQPGQKTMTESVLCAGKVIAIDRVMDSPYADTRTAFLSLAQSMLGLPLISDNQRLGAVLITFSKPRDFSADDIRRGEQIAKHIALALAKVRLHEQVREHANNLELLVSKRTQELKAAYEQLQEMDHLKSELIDHISHELRTPVANLRLYLDLLEYGPSEKFVRYRSVLSKQVERLMELIEGVIQLSQLDVLKSQDKASVIDLNKIVDAVIVTKRKKNNFDNTRLLFVAHSKPLFVFGNSEQLTKMAANLVDNAIRYTPRGEIRVSTFPVIQQELACLQVEDTGMGIASEDIPYLFSKFYRGQIVRQSNVPGIGLGLTIVKRIVDLHNGRINVQSQPGKGSSFLVSLPSHKQ